MKWTSGSLKLKFAFYAFKFRSPWLYNLLLIVVGVAILSGIWLGYQTLGTLDEEVRQSQGNNETDIKTFSVNGDITAIAENKVTIKIGIVENETLVFQEKSVSILAQTEIVKIKILNKEVTTIPATQKDFKVNRPVVVYTTVNPASGNGIIADKIEIIE